MDGLCEDCGGRRSAIHALALLFGATLAATDAFAPLYATEAAPDLKFESGNTFRLSNWAIVTSPAGPSPEWAVGTMPIFGRLEVNGTGADTVVLAMEEQPDMGSYRFCIGREGTCHDVELGVTGGMLHLVSDVDFYQIKNESFHLQTRDYTAQRAEVSATLPSGLQVYQEVIVQPPEAAPDCSDYPTADAERFGCLLLGELLTPPDRTEAEMQTLISALPDKLVQPKEDYELVFAEDFNGDLDGDGSDPMCTQGGFPRLTADVLDPAVWDYQTDNCDQRDAAGNPLLTVRDGHLEYAMARDGDGNRKGATPILTHGKVAFRYGYLELKYTVGLKRSYGYVNLAVILGEYYKPTWNSLAKYGLALGDIEEFLSYSELEGDFYEYVTSSGREFAHQNQECQELRVRATIG